jgi:hypothetical protein
MISALISGTLVKSPEAKLSGNGREYVAFVVKSGDDFIRCLLFADDLRPYMKLQRGDPVALVGTLTASLYERSGEQKVGLSAMCSRCISPVVKEAKKPKDQSGEFRAAAVAQRAPAMDRQDGLSDDLPWN